jgi:phosphoribosylaminoimidazolecarboxamide formyltransferase / IMP cyclohydrolase
MPDQTIIPVKRALLSVSDKNGLLPLAQALAKMGVDLISTGGTAKALQDAGIKVTPIQDVTGHPEIMDGRVKTLHPRIHGGLLGVRDNKAHVQQMKENDITAIDLVVVNLYPFQQTVAKPGVSLEEAIENIDIGGPAMLRSSAKNHRFVTVVVDPADYAPVLEEIQKNGGTSLETRKRLAVKVFSLTADYDSAISTYLSEKLLNKKVLRLRYTDGQTMRYGENPHQQAVFYKSGIQEACLANAEQLAGKEISFNNIVDGDAALEAVKELEGEIGVAIIKHMNPCGYATGATAAEALEAAWAGDPVSAYGGVVATSAPVDLGFAQKLKGRFVEIIIAPDFSREAVEFLVNKNKDTRLLRLTQPLGRREEKISLKHVVGGLLVQDRDLLLWQDWKTVTEAQFPDNKKKLAEFTWKACKHTKSNAIVLGREYKPGFFSVLGMGAGQPNRVDSVRKLAATKAADNIALLHKESGSGEALDAFTRKIMAETVLASDAFFPFADSIEVAHGLNIFYIVQPSGSKKDSEVIAACNQHKIAMVFTGTRHFRH